ncbi:hypothetical protein ACQJBY_012346 [Aegilops geniculata]
MATSFQVYVYAIITRLLTTRMVASKVVLKILTYPNQGNVAYATIQSIDLETKIQKKHNGAAAEPFFGWMKN